MRLCTFEVHTHLGWQGRLGAVVDDGVIDLNFATAEASGNVRLADALVPPSLLGLLDGGEVSMNEARGSIASLPADVRVGKRDETLRYRWDEIRLRTPLPNARSVRDFFAFESHVKMGFEKRGEPMPQEWYEFPVYYQTGHHNLLGTDQDVPWPSFTERFDYELELAVIIGREGRNVPASTAREYIAGYTILNDFSARDIQRREMKVRLGPAK
jgi:2-keto-4-pentenoate hydratase/2-oxohepta-3-ene-1,7-dioic acid hydratase in catechol pathway